MIKQSAKAEFSFNEESRSGNSVRFTAVGHVNIENASVMEKKLEQCLASGCVDIVVDMYRVTFFSSAGIRTVLSIFKKAKAQNGKFRIASPSENVRNVLGMTSLNEMLLK
jgi:anti-anti-sigma factor